VLERSGEEEFREEVQKVCTNGLPRKITLEKSAVKPSHACRESNQGGKPTKKDPGKGGGTLGRESRREKNGDWNSLTMRV